MDRSLRGLINNKNGALFEWCVVDEEIFLKECEEKVSIEADYVLRSLERLAEEEMLEFDWIVLEFRKQLNRKIKERGINDEI